MIECWDLLPDTQGIDCPISFTEEELKDFHKLEQTWFDLNALVNHWREELGGVSEDGWVRHERYDEAVRKERELKAKLIATAEGDVEDIELLSLVWPFRDFEEDGQSSL
jgi:hypothetical protein